MVQCLMPKMQTWNQKQDSFHHLIDKDLGWIAFVKFYFYDAKNLGIKHAEATGFLNSKWTIITACHNLYLFPENIKCSHCVIYLRDPSRNYKQIAIKSRPASQWFQNAQHDLALIRLDEQVKHFNDEAFFGDHNDFKAIQKYKCQQLYVAGFSTKIKNESNGNSEPQFNRMKFIFEKFTQNGVQNKGETQKGLQGSPIIYQSEDKDEAKLKVIGMHLGNNHLLNKTKSLRFSDTVINLIYFWMNQLSLDRVEIQSRFSMMQAQIMKIIENTKRQLLPKGSYSTKNSMKHSMIKRQEQHDPQFNGRQNQPSRKDNQIQSAIAKEHQKLSHLLHNKQPQQKISEVIGDIHALQNQDVKADLLYSNSINIIEQSQKQNDSEDKKQSLNRLKQKKQKHFANKNQLQIVEQLHLSKKSTKQEQSNGLKCFVIENEFLSQQQPKKKWGSFDKSKPKEQSNEMGNNKTLNNNNKNKVIYQSFECKKEIQNPNQSSDNNSSQSSFNVHSTVNAQYFNFKSSSSKSASSGQQEPKPQCIEIAYSNLFKFPYNCIGYITFLNKQGNQDTFGNGSLISPTLVLTAARIFMDKDNKLGQVVPSSFRIVKEKNEVNPYKTIKIKNYRVSRQYIDYKEAIADYYQQKTNIVKQKWDNQILKMQEQQQKYDFALLELEESITRNQYFDLFDNSNFVSQLTVCGFTQDKNRFCQVSQKTHLQISIKPQNECIRYNITKIPGQIGSPIFVDNNGIIKIVGIHSSYSIKDKSNIGVCIVYKKIQAIEHWASQMHPTSSMQDPKNTIYQLNRQLKLLNNKYQEAVSQIKRMADQIQKLKQNLQSLRQSNQNISCQKNELNQQLEKSQNTKLKILEDNKCMNKLISQMKKKIQSLQPSILVKKINQAGSSHNLQMVQKHEQKNVKPDSSLKNNRNYAKKQQVCMSIVGNKYGQVTKILKSMQNKEKITSLTIENTVITNLYSVFINIYRCTNVLSQTVSINIFSMQLKIKSGYRLQHSDTQINLVYFINHSDSSSSQIEKEAGQIPDILSQFKSLQHFTFYFKHSLHKSQIFDKIVEVLNKMKLQRIQIYIHPDYKKEAFDWTKNLQEVAVVKQYRKKLQ